MFKKGDRVTAYGHLGTVIEVYDELYRAVEVRFDNGMFSSFCIDGKMESWHIEAVLKKLPQDMILELKREIDAVFERLLGLLS